jgi:hypothetical protein
VSWATSVLARVVGPVAVASALAWGTTTAGGCSDRACFEWSSDRGACPGAAEALDRMSPRCGGGTVVAVESEGDFDGSHCCYDVAKNDGFGAPPRVGCDTTAASVGASVGIASSSSSSSAASASGGGEGGAGGTSGVGGEAGAGGRSVETGCDVSGEPCQPTCAPPPVPPSNGTCVTVGGTVQCNPLTNENCGPGTTCDALDGGFACRAMASAPGDVCQPCVSSDACGAALTCFGSCFRFCCSHDDCGGGQCYKKPFPGSLLTAVGVCIEPP